MVTAAVAIGGAVVVLIHRAITFDSYWFDESGQYWMAQGQTHFAPPGTPPGGLRAIWDANAAANLDSGGFTLLLRLWTELLPAQTMRILPLLFGLLAAAVTVLLVRTTARASMAVSMLAGSIVLLSPLLREYSFELRAYTMEAASTLLAALVVVLPIGFWSRWSRAVIAGLTLSLLATSRYSALVPAAIAVGLVVLDARIGLRQRLLLATMVAPAGFVSLGMLRAQNPTARPPSYVNPFVAASSWQSLPTAILDPEAAWLFLSLAALLIFGVRIVRTSPNLESEPVVRFGVFAGLVVGAFVLLSLLGFYPFRVVTRWDISINVLLHAGASILAALILGLGRVRAGSSLTAGAALLMAGLLAVGFAPVTKERMVAAMATCYDPSKELVLNEGALPTFRLHHEVLGTVRLGDDLSPRYFVDYRVDASQSSTSTQRAQVVPRSEVGAQQQILLNRHESSDLEVFLETHSLCFGGAEDPVVFLAPRVDDAAFDQ